MLGPALRQIPLLQRIFSRPREPNHDGFATILSCFSQGASSPTLAGRSNGGGGGDGGVGVGGGGVGRPRFDNAISVMENFEVSEIKRFLRWANYCMTDALQVRNMLKWSVVGLATCQQNRIFCVFGSNQTTFISTRATLEDVGVQTLFSRWDLHCKRVASVSRFAPPCERDRLQQLQQIFIRPTV